MKLEDIKAYLPIVVFAVGVIGAAAVIPIRLSAVEKTAERLQEQMMVIGDYVEQKIVEEKYEKELSEKAPKGYAWNPLTRSYEKAKKK